MSRASRDARLGAIDIGTNTVLLLIAEVVADDSASGDPCAGIVPVLERATITRLGRGVDASRALDPDAVERTLSCLADYAEELRRAKVDAIDVVGTSAMRDAKGGESFVARATAILGVAPRTVSGDEEARLAFAGALSGLGLDRTSEQDGPRDGSLCGRSSPLPVAVVDIGGGSTEIVIGELGATGPSATWTTSVDVGSVRLTERHVRSDPPSPSELDSARRDARAAVRTALRKGAPSSATESSLRIVGVAGTVTTLAAVVQNLDPYDGARVHGSWLSREQVDSAVARLSVLPLAERRNVPGLDPERADVIVSGGLLVQEAISALGGAGLYVSDRGVRWGLVLRMARPITSPLVP